MLPEMAVPRRLGPLSPARAPLDLASAVCTDVSIDDWLVRYLPGMQKRQPELHQAASRAQSVKPAMYSKSATHQSLIEATRDICGSAGAF